MAMKLFLFAGVALIASFCNSRGAVTEALIPGGFGFVGSIPRTTTIRRRQLDATTTAGDEISNGAEFDDCKMTLRSLLEKVPSNQSTSKELTREILTAVSVLENEYPTSEANVVERLPGNWELIWTAQDLTSLSTNDVRQSINPLATFINPLENQSYSNNPVGRSNPILPQNLQDGLENIGLLITETADKDGQTNAIKSTQSINLKKGQIRNVVAFQANNPTPLFSKNGRTKGFITVDVKGSVNPNDARKIDVKFDKCRVTILDSPIDVTFPLGVIGPTGWLRTIYIDDDIRITRGHKGSVFILSRTRTSNTASSLSRLLWKEFCILTGKVLDGQSASVDSPKSDFRSLLPEVISVDDDVGMGGSLCSAEQSIIGTSGANHYRRYYFRNPCVPLDFGTINEALCHCPRLQSEDMNLLSDETTRYSGVGTVVLMPGVYAERISICGATSSSVEQDNVNGRIAIRAAFPKFGATIQSANFTHADDIMVEDKPCISISNCDGGTSSEGLSGRGIRVDLSHLEIVHSSQRGTDIWNGNTAISVIGRGAHAIIDSCILQSDTGRGLVVTTESVCEVYNSSIVDCAATGFYLGDWGSRALISRCNIVRNGFGSKRSIPLVGGENFGAVPAGHSGVYIESSMCWIDDCLLAGNCLTGLSVVRGGVVSLSGSDVTENGHDSPVLIEDRFDVRDAAMLNGEGISIRGEIVEGPLTNNFTSLHDAGEKTNLFKGGAIRDGDMLLSHLSL